jgi:hypothetical protein
VTVTEDGVRVKGGVGGCVVAAADVKARVEESAPSPPLEKTGVEVEAAIRESVGVAEISFRCK